MGRHRRDTLERERGTARSRGRRAAVVAALMVAVAIVAIASPPGAQPARAATLPTGFQESVVFSGLVNPTAVRFAADGRVFVAEKSGLIKVFDNLSDTSATTFADLRTNVHNFWDRGLLGMALDPAFPANPWVYVLYAYDHVLGDSQPAPKWGAPGATSDGCPTPPGPTADGCVISGRLSRLQAAGNVMTGSEQVLIEDWCQQYPSHSVGSLAFGNDGALYVSGGDGASFNFADYGQDGSPLNPCGDPPGGPGSVLTPPTAEGGALRSQDLRTAGDPAGLDGAILRVDPATGAAMANNPNAAHPDPNVRRIIADGLRNPFRLTTRPGTAEIWVGDVGWNVWEELNRIVGPTDATVENFGWPCYEGNGRQAGYDGANLNVCENLYSAGGGAITTPYFTYSHAAKVVPNETCPSGGSSVAGLAFVPADADAYPAQYQGALFFADYSRDCIWVMFPGANGLPDPATTATFAAGAANPVELQIGPTGELFYPDFDGGAIRRITYAPAGPTQCPVGQFLSKYYGDSDLDGAPLLVRCESAINYDWGSGSPATGVPADHFSARWSGQHSFSAGAYTFSARADDGVRVFVDGSLVIDGWVGPPGTTYTASRSMTAGDHTVTVEYYENVGGALAQVSWQADTPANTPPSPTIATPVAGTTWKVGDVISFSGSATDAQDGSLPAGALSWALVLQHCPSNCHEHPLQTFSGVASGSFVAPDHDYPSHLELRLTATDSGGLQSTVNVVLQPRTTTLNFASSPSGLALVHAGSSAATPFSRTVIVGSNNSISAPSPQALNGSNYEFVSWSDQGAATHNVTAAETPTTYTATYRVIPQSPVHVGDLDATKSTLNKNFWKTSVTIVVHDANEARVAGVTVTGSWSAGATGTSTCTTGAAGTCTVSIAKVASTQPSATFGVTNLTATARTYAAPANHDPDGDSNGTSITVTRP